jgi:hypothetical protein
MLIAMRGTVQEIVLVGGHERKSPRKGGIDVYMACGAGAAAAAQSEEFVEAAVADDLHD